MEIEKKRTTERCYWESQPTGCLKPHCPFLHEAAIKVQPYDPEKVVAITHAASAAATGAVQAAVAPKIIVNRNKLDEIMQTTPNRMVILPAKPRQALKDRLGQRVIKTEIEIHDCSDPEEENLRQGAISTLDLRSRIRNTTTKRKFSEEDEEESYSEPETKKVLSSVVKKVKKEKKEKKKKKDKDRESSSKSRKRSKKSSPSSSRSEAAGLAVKSLREIAPTAKVPRRQPRSLSVTSSGDDSGAEDTLAKRIAAQRQKDGPGKSRSSSSFTKKNRKSSERKKSRKTTSPNLERSVEIVNKSDQEESSEYVSLKKLRKLKVPGGSSSTKSGKSNADDSKESVQSVIDDVDALLKSSDPTALTSSKSLNDSVDLMKGLDEFINS